MYTVQLYSSTVHCTAATGRRNVSLMSITDRSRRAHLDVTYWPDFEPFVDTINVGYMGTGGPDLLDASLTGRAPQPILITPRGACC
jgi:hypothetical protein